MTVSGGISSLGLELDCSILLSIMPLSLGFRGMRVMHPLHLTIHYLHGIATWAGNSGFCGNNSKWIRMNFFKFCFINFDWRDTVKTFNTCQLECIWRFRVDWVSWAQRGKGPITLTLVRKPTWRHSYKWMMLRINYIYKVNRRNWQSAKTQAISKT
jgi:hypothetical protein